MKKIKSISLILAVVFAISLFSGCKEENPLKEKEKTSSKTASKAQELIIPLDISLDRSNAIAFAGLIAKNNAGETEGTYYINYRDSSDEIIKLLEKKEADVGVIPKTEALELLSANEMMRIVAVNNAPQLFAKSEKPILSAEDFKKASVLLISADEVTKNAVENALPKSASLTISTGNEDDRVLFASGLYDVVLGDLNSIDGFENEEKSEISNVSSIFEGLSSFALVADYETFLGNKKGFERLEKELSASASTISAQELIDLYLAPTQEKAEFLANNLKFQIEFLNETDPLFTGNEAETQ